MPPCRRLDTEDRKKVDIHKILLIFIPILPTYLNNLLFILPCSKTCKFYATTHSKLCFFSNLIG